MHSYDLSQWVLFFFIYSFAGWIWESCYVSARKRRWVNRGFMHGPMLPIYGSGALVILVSTIGVRDNSALIFLMGMCGATVLEYVTGAVMERLFHVRYWDYSRQKLNLNGYICLSSSLCWGAFSVLLVRVVHVPIETAVLRIPLIAADIIAFCLTVAATVDFTQSFNEAMDMKRILMQLEESREQIAKMQENLKAAAQERIDEYRKRSEEVLDDYRKRSEEALDDYRKRSEAMMGNYRERADELLAEYRSFSAELRQDYRKQKDALVRKASAEKERYLAHIQDNREERRRQLAEISAKAEALFREEIPSRVDGIIRKERSEELGEIRDKIARELQKMSSRTDRRYLKIAGMLRRNPTAVSEKFREALEEIRKSMDEK